MAINIKNLEELIQKKAYAVTSSTPTADLGDIVEASLLATNSLREYDSAGLLPAATSNEKIAFVKSDKSIRFNNGSKWDTLTSGAAQAGASSPAYLTFQGASYGYGMGGRGGSPDAMFNKIEKYSFTSDGNSTDVGDLSASPAARDGVSGGKSSTKAYAMGGGSSASPAIATTHIESLPFASDGNSADIGYDVTVNFHAGQAGTCGDRDYVYRSGGRGPGTTVQNVIDKFQSSAEANSTDVGDLITAVYDHATTSSDTVGYVYGGNKQPISEINNIDTFPFASDGNATDAGDLHTAVLSSSGASSATHGYSLGGYRTPIGNAVNNIQKFPFVSFTTGTDVGDLLSIAYITGGTSSQTHGYKDGGWPTNSIEKVSYATDGNSTDVGDMSSNPHYRHGNADY